MRDLCSAVCKTVQALNWHKKETHKNFGNHKWQRGNKVFQNSYVARHEHEDKSMKNIDERNNFNEEHNNTEDLHKKDCLQVY